MIISSVLKIFSCFFQVLILSFSKIRARGPVEQVVEVDRLLLRAEAVSVVRRVRRWLAVKVVPPPPLLPLLQLPLPPVREVSDLFMVQRRTEKFHEVRYIRENE